MSTSKDGYHHGDLKNALIEAGVRALAESGVEGLSLRKLARDVGVSHNAPYMHFADKEAVLAAIAQQGFDLLGTAIDHSQVDVGNAPIEARLVAAAHSYVNFALSHPNHLLVMFGNLPVSDYPELEKTAHETFQKLIQIMRDGLRHGQLIDEDAEQLALLLWTNVHGLSALLIADKVPDYVSAGRTNAALIEQGIQMLCRGILSQ